MSGSVWATRSSHSARSRGHRRGAERRDRRGREVRDRDQQRLLGRADLVRRRPSRTSARRRTPPRRRPRRRAAGPRRSSAPRRGVSPRRPSEPGPVERRVVDRVVGVAGHLVLEAATRVVGHAEREQQLEARCGPGPGAKTRGHRRARRRRRPASTITASAVSRSCRRGERGRAGREDGERAGAGAAVVRPREPPPAASPGGDRPEPPRHALRAIVASRHRTPRPRPRPRRPRRGRLCSPR